MSAPLNGCHCGEDFTSLRLFDAHRVGVHAYDYSPDRPDGRRCLNEAEKVERGWEKVAKGRWQDPAAVEDARLRFRGLRRGDETAQGYSNEGEAA